MVRAKAKVGGFQVMQLFMTLNNEAGNLNEVPHINIVKINKRPAEFKPIGSCIQIVPGPDCKLKLPIALEPQVCRQPSSHSKNLLYAA